MKPIQEYGGSVAPTTTVTVHGRLCQRDLGLRTKSGPKSPFLLEIKVLVWRYTQSKLPEVHCKVSTGTSQKMRISSKSLYFLKC